MSMEDYNSCSDMDDDWLYESIMRYNTLQMFYLPNIPDHVLQLDDSTLCIATRNSKCENVELLKFNLPGKLTKPAEEEGRSKENDLKILYGMYIDKSIHQIGAIKEENKIVTSQTGKMGLQIYNFEPDESNRKQELLATIKLYTPNFAVHQEEKKLICSKCNHKPLILYDMFSEGILKELKHPLLSSELQTEDICDCNNLKCQLLDSNTLAVLDSNTGVVILIDLRTENTISKLGKDENIAVNELWTLSSFDYKVYSSYFGKLSTNGNLHLYDIRNSDKSIVSECFNSAVNNCNILKLKIGNSNRFSISGLDSNVYVYDIVQNCFQSAFTHNGHCRLVDKKHDCPVNDHIWLPSVGNNFIVSVCENASLHCWEYNK